MHPIPCLQTITNLISMLPSFYSQIHTQLILPISAQTTFYMTTYVITASPETASAEMTHALTTYAQTTPSDETGTIQDVAIP
jgi:hypothetical protein